MQTPAAADVKGLIAALDRASEQVPLADIPSLIGDLERLQVLLSARLARAADTDATGSSLDELRHLTPLQVSELLSLKAAYVHELCRTGKLPAMKSGKYWMIPVAGLRRWLTSRNGRIDDETTAGLQSLNLRGDDGACRQTLPLRQPRRGAR